jgi:2-methylisocitrate lyase-like PEP mutase family enzyme
LQGDALLCEQAGFAAAYLSGYGVSASQLAEPDVGLICYAEMAERVGSLSAALDIPLLCDAEAGFGGPINIHRTVRGYERAGAAAVQIEDQDTPRRCGHVGGKRLVDREEMVLRIRIAAEARRDPDTVLIARTDAVAGEGLDEALARLDLCLEAGADIVFADAVESEADLERVAQAFPKRAMANIVPGGKTPAFDAAALAQMGFAVAIFPSLALVAAAGGMRRAYALLAEQGRPEGAGEAGLGVDELHRILGFDAFHAFEARLAELKR